jgi:hypothetical protein
MRLDSWRGAARSKGKRSFQRFYSACRAFSHLAQPGPGAQHVGVVDHRLFQALARFIRSACPGSFNPLLKLIGLDIHG